MGKKLMLNFGCGNIQKKGYINIDLHKIPGVDMVLDMEKYPYPFKDNSADKIACESVLQFLNDVGKTMEEFHRILKPGGVLFVHVPHFTSKNTWKNPYQKRGFSYNTLDFFQKPKYYYTDWKFTKIKRKLVFGKKYSFWNWIIEPIANLFPILYEDSPLRIFPALRIEVWLWK